MRCPAHSINQQLTLKDFVILQCSGWNIRTIWRAAQPQLMFICRSPKAEARSYPCTLILENDSTARDEIGRPIDIAGRKVVKISIRFTCGRSS